MILSNTVPMGKINGPIYYANIVMANTAIFFPNKAGNTSLSWFIAWLNLDLGIETCFYNGLNINAYVKTWLQFIFPFVHLVLGYSNHHFKQILTESSKVIWSQCCSSCGHLVSPIINYAKLLRLTITIITMYGILMETSLTLEYCMLYIC